LTPFGRAEGGSFAIRAIALHSAGASVVNMICLGFELARRCQRLDRAGVRWCDSWNALNGSEGRARNGTGNSLPWRSLELRRGFGWVFGTEFATGCWRRR